MAVDLKNVDPQWAWAEFEPDGKSPWNRAQAAHLYRRAGFAANSSELDDAVKKSPAQAVGALMNPGDTSDFDEESDQLGRTIRAGGNLELLPAWWLYRMLYTPDQQLEKTTLFWHGHFATSAAKVTEPKLMLDQNSLLRRHARGDFGTLVHEISRDPAMLIYLDSRTNRKVAPNENYGRELMELFCLGLDQYTEKDIQEVARCFTGSEVNRHDKFQFNKHQHDSGEKTVLGKTGKFKSEDAVRIVLQQPAAARFIVRKLIRYFVFDEPEVSDALVEPLAKQMRENELNVGPVIGRILGSNLFFSEYAIGRKIRSPVELGVGLLRALGGWSNTNRLAEALGELGQLPFFPPNVKGWDGGRAWINSSTLLGRANLVYQIMNSDETKFADGDLESVASKQGAKSPEEIVEWLVELLVAVPVPDAARRELTDVAKNGKGDASRRIAATIHTLSTLPEFQLS